MEGFENRKKQDVVSVKIASVYTSGMDQSLAIKVMNIFLYKTRHLGLSNNIRPLD